MNRESTAETPPRPPPKKKGRKKVSKKTKPAGGKPKPPSTGTPQARRAPRFSSAPAEPGAPPIVRRAFSHLRLFHHGGFGAAPSGGPQLWRTTVGMRQAYNLTPAVDKGEIERYKGCDYYSEKGYTLALTDKGGRGVSWAEICPRPSAAVLSRASTSAELRPWRPVPRCGHSMVVVPGGGLLVWGGRNFQGGGGVIADGGLGVVGEGWREIGGSSPGAIPVRGKPPMGRTGHAAVLVGSVMYIIGGFTAAGRFVRSVVALDIERWVWFVPTVTGTPPPPLAFHTADLVSGRDPDGNRLRRIVLFGGVTPVTGPDGPLIGSDGPVVHALGAVHFLDVSDPNNVHWSSPPIAGVGPSPRAWHASCSSGTEVFVYGGSEVLTATEGGNGAMQTRLTGDFFCLDTAGMVWHEVVPARPLPPAHPDAQAMGPGYGRAPGKRDEAALLPGNDDTLILFGGWTGRHDPTDLELAPWTGEIHVFDLRELTWHRITPPAASPPPCYGHRCVAVRVGVAMAGLSWAEVAGGPQVVSGGSVAVTVHSLDETGAQRRMGGDRFSMVVRWDEPIDEEAADDQSGSDATDDEDRDMHRPPRVQKRIMVVKAQQLPEVGGGFNPHATPKRKNRAAHHHDDVDPVAVLYDCDDGRYRGTVTFFRAVEYDISFRLEGGGTFGDAESGSDDDTPAPGDVVDDTDRKLPGEPVRVVPPSGASATATATTHSSSSETHPPGHVTVVPGPACDGRSWTSCDAGYVTAGETVSIGVELWDAHGNRCDPSPRAVTVEVRTPRGKLLRLTRARRGGVWSFTPTVAETVSVVGFITRGGDAGNDQEPQVPLLPGSHEIEVRAAVLDRLVIKGKSAGRGMAGIPVVLTLTGVDKHGNEVMHGLTKDSTDLPVMAVVTSKGDASAQRSGSGLPTPGAGAAASASMPGAAAAAPPPPKLVPVPPSNYMLSFTPYRSGTLSVHVKDVVTSRNLLKGGREVTVGAGRVVASRCIVTGDGASNGERHTVGKPLKLRVTLRDEYDNPVPGASSLISLSITPQEKGHSSAAGESGTAGPSADTGPIPCTITESHTGSHDLAFTVKQSGPHLVSLSAHGMTLLPSLHSITEDNMNSNGQQQQQQSQHARIHHVLYGLPSALSLSHARLEGVAVSRCVAGVPGRFLARFCDKYGNPVAVPVGHVNGGIDGRGGRVTVEAVGVPAWLAHAGKKPPVSADGEEVLPGSGGGGASLAESHKQALQQQAGNGINIPTTPAGIAEAAFEHAAANRPSQREGTAYDTFALRYTILTTGLYTLTTRVDSTEFGSKGGREVRCRPGPAVASKCVVRGVAIENSVRVDEEGTVTIELKDQYGNAVDPEGYVIKGELVTARGAEVVSPLRLVRAEGSGSLMRGTFVSTMAGPMTLHITLNGQPLAKSPFSVDVTARGVSARNCTLLSRELPPGEVAGLGGAGSVVSGGAESTGGGGGGGGGGSPAPASRKMSSANSLAGAAGRNRTTSSAHQQQQQQQQIQQGFQRVTGSDLGSCHAGTVRHVIIEARDTYGNRVLEGGARVSVRVREPGEESGDDDDPLAADGGGVPSVPVVASRMDSGLAAPATPSGSHSGAKPSSGTPVTSTPSGTLSSRRGASRSVTPLTPASNNPGAGDPDAHLGGISVPVRDRGDGTYEAMFRLEAAGRTFVSITVDAGGAGPTSVLPKLWLPLQVHPGPLCLPTTTCSGPGLRHGAVGALSKFSIHLRDRYLNPVDGVEPIIDVAVDWVGDESRADPASIAQQCRGDLSLDEIAAIARVSRYGGNPQPRVEISAPKAGVIRCSFTPTRCGKHTVTVRVNGTVIGHVRSAKDGEIEQGEVVVSIDPGVPEPKKCTVEFADKDALDHHAAGDDDDNTPHDSRRVRNAQSAVVGRRHFFLLVVRDVHGNATWIEGSGEPHVLLELDRSVPVEIVPTGIDGIHIASYECPSAGSYAGRATVGAPVGDGRGFKIRASLPEADPLKSKVMMVASAPVSPATTPRGGGKNAGKGGKGGKGGKTVQLVPPGTQTITAGGEITFVVVASGRDGERLRTGGEMVSAVLLDDAGEVTARAKVEDNHDGTYTCSFRPTTAGSFGTRCFMRAEPCGEGCKGGAEGGLPGASVTVLPASASGERSELRGSILDGGVAGTQLDVRLVLRDAFGNPIPAGSWLGSASAVVSGPVDINAELQPDTSDGPLLIGRVTPEHAGVYDLTVTLREGSEDEGEEAEGRSFVHHDCPVSLTIEHGPLSPNHSTLHGEGPELPVTAGVRASFHVSMRDSFGNPAFSTPMSKVACTIDCLAEDGTVAQRVSGVALADDAGTATDRLVRVSFTAPRPGKYAARVVLQGALLGSGGGSGGGSDGANGDGAGDGANGDGSDPYSFRFVADSAGVFPDKCSLALRDDARSVPAGEECGFVIVSRDMTGTVRGDKDDAGEFAVAVTCHASSGGGIAGGGDGGGGGGDRGTAPAAATRIVRGDKPGEYIAWVTPRLAGWISVTATAIRGSVPLGDGKPIVVEVGPAPGGKVLLGGAGTRRVLCGHEASVIITAVDNYGNGVPVPASVSVLIMYDDDDNGNGNGNGNGNDVDDADGASRIVPNEMGPSGGDLRTIVCRYRPTRLGRHTVTVRLGGKTRSSSGPAGSLFTAPEPARPLCVPTTDTVGVDIGMCWSTVGVSTEQGYQAVARIPSVLALGPKGEFLFGAQALAVASECPSASMKGFRRILGRTAAEMAAEGAGGGGDKTADGDAGDGDGSGKGERSVAEPSSSSGQDESEMAREQRVMSTGSALVDMPGDGPCCFEPRVPAPKGATGGRDMRTRVTVAACVTALVGELLRLSRDRLDGWSPSSAVVAVPGSYADQQRTAMRDAVAAAGLSVIRLINDPTAALIAYHEEVHLKKHAVGVVLKEEDAQGAGARGGLMSTAREERIMLGGGEDGDEDDGDDGDRHGAGKEGGVADAGAADKRRRVLVCDFGGCKLDVCVADISAMRIRIAASDGTTRLGGVDVDARLYYWLKQQETEQQSSKGGGAATAPPRSDPQIAAALAAAEKGKVEPGAANHLPRSQLSHAVGDFVTYLRGMVDAVVAESGTVAERVPIDAVVLVGGSSSLVHVTEAVTEAAAAANAEVAAAQSEAQRAAYTALIEAHAARVARNKGRSRIGRANAKDEELPPAPAPVTAVVAEVSHLGAGAVAVGAIVNARKLAGTDRRVLHVVDLVTVTLGIEVEGGAMAPVVTRGSRVPCEVAETFATSVDDQTELILNVYEGEAPMVAECHRLGSYVLQPLPPDLPAGSPVTVTFHVDEGGVLDVHAQCGEAVVRVQVGKRATVAEGVEESGGANDHHQEPEEVFDEA